MTVADMSAGKARYTHAEEVAIVAAHSRGEVPRCPRCNVAMTTRSLGGGSFGLGYARQREWLLCPKCKRSVLFDGRRGTRN